MIGKHKSSLSLINPNWKINPLWADTTLIMPFLERGGDITRNLADGFPNGACQDSPWYKDDYGLSLYFDGTHRCYTDRDSQDYDFTHSSFMFWCSTESVGIGEEWMIERYVDSDNRIQLGRENNVARFEGKYGGSSTVLVYGPAINDGKLHCVVGILDGDVGGDMWVDGVKGTTDTSLPGAGTFNTGNLDIGGAGSDGWLGTISSAVYWNRVLTAEDVWELYQLGPSLGLGDYDDINLFAVASQGGGSAFQPAWAANSNLIL